MSKQGYSKAKGRTWEAACCAWLRSLGIPAERRRLSGAQDMGDVGAWPLVVVECKAEKRLNLAGYMDELVAEVANADRRLGKGHIGLLLVKRHGSGDSPEKGYAVMAPELAVAALRALMERRPASGS